MIEALEDNRRVQLSLFPEDRELNLRRNAERFRYGWIVWSCCVRGSGTRVGSKRHCRLLKTGGFEMVGEQIQQERDRGGNGRYLLVSSTGKSAIQLMPVVSLSVMFLNKMYKAAQRAYIIQFQTSVINLNRKALFDRQNQT